MLPKQLIRSCPHLPHSSTQQCLLPTSPSNLFEEETEVRMRRKTYDGGFSAIIAWTLPKLDEFQIFNHFRNAKKRTQQRFISQGTTAAVRLANMSTYSFSNAHSMLQLSQKVYFFFPPIFHLFAASFTYLYLEDVDKALTWLASDPHQPGSTQRGLSAKSLWLGGILWSPWVPGWPSSLHDFRACLGLRLSALVEPGSWLPLTPNIWVSCYLWVILLLDYSWPAFTSWHRSLCWYCSPFKHWPLAYGRCSWPQLFAWLVIPHLPNHVA